MVAIAELNEPRQFKHSEAMLRQLLEHAAVGIAMAGMDGRIVYANKAMSDALGVPTSTITGSRVQSVFAPVDDGEPLRFDVASERECRILHPSRGILWTGISISHVQSETSGAPTHIIVHLTDIDRRKRAELATAEAELRWKFALDGAGQGVWDHDLNQKTCFYSAAWRRMRGFGADEYVDPSAESWLARVHPDDRARLADETSRQNTGELPENVFEYRERHRDGHWIWVLSRGRPVAWNEDGSVARIIGTDTDITSIKAAYQSVAMERERFETTLQSLSDGVVSCRVDGTIEFINPAAARLSGCAVHEALGRPLAGVVLSDAITGAVVNCVHSPGRIAITAEAEIPTPNEGWRHIKYTVSPVLGASGDLLSIAVVLQDTTEQKRSEMALQHAASHDGLTGLPNRKAFEEELVAAIERTRGSGLPSSLCFVDLDRFKSVNDTHGHLAGDTLLREVAARLRSCCRKGDFVARIGGDEFAAILRGEADEADEVARRFVKAVAEIGFSWNGSTHDVGVSVGTTSVLDATPAQLMSAADDACYAAKDAGRNRMVRL